MENKYRAYIKWAKIILEVEIIDFKRKRVYCKTEMNKPNPCDFYNFDDIILMQYTGLKDKNDVDIYEGDIVIITEEDEDSCFGREFSYKGVVSYANSLKLSQYVSQYPTSFCLVSKSFYREQALLFNDRWDYEVIGNIYENPDLLKD